MNRSPKPPGVRYRLPMALSILLLLFGEAVFAHASHETVPDCTPPGASITPSGNLSCANTSVTLAGSATVSTVTYSWSGPGGYSSMLQNIVVSLPGTYNLTVTNTNGGCTSATSVTVTQNITLPGATAGVSHALDCSHTSVTLQATTPTTGATFRWIGNSFTSTQQNPTITVPGGYTLNVTNPANGCTSTATVNVTQSVTAPGATPSVSGPLTCTTTQTELNVTSPTPTATFSWTGPNGFTDNTENPLATTPGTYTVVATNPANSCTSTASVNVVQNITPPGASITASGQITCSSGSVTLSGSSPAIDVNYSWSGPSGFNSTVQNPVATVAGPYVLTITKASNGCTSVANHTVVVNNTRPGASASVSGQLNCTTPSVTLQGSSPTTGVTYRWIGPTGSGFTSTEQNPVTTVKGGYTLTVTSTANGCTSTTATSVIQSVNPPANVAIATPAVLTCTTLSVTLSGSSTTSGVTYAWTGPGAITNPNTATPTVTAPGVYTLTVTNPANSCTATQTVTVLQNITSPADVAIATPAILTCTTQTVTLAASSSTSGVTYSWSGPGSITNQTSASASVTQPGVYTVVVTDPVNGCITSRSVTVQQNITPPADVAIVPPAILTCTRLSVTLAASSTTSGVAYAWTGPGTITNPASASISVSTPGVYNLVVTNPVNGCTTTASVTVEQNITQPGVTTSVSGILTCNVLSVTLTANSSTTGLTYAWTGPGGFTSTASNPVVTAGGPYNVTVTNPVNGCTSSSGINVQENKTAPGVTSSVVGVLTCSVSTVSLGASSPTSGVLYSWTGPDNYTSAEQFPTTTVPGLYTVTATNPVNGCTSTHSVSVTQNNTPPAGVRASGSGDITCSEPSITLFGESTTTGVTYQWEGPGSFTSAEQNPEAFEPGIYLLTVTNPANGCKSTDGVVIEENTEGPEGVTATASANLSCAVTSVTLTGTSTTAGVTYSWTGPGSFTSIVAAPVVLTPGTYSLVVRNPINGCTASASATITQNTTAPGVTASVSGKLTCTVTSVTLNATSSTGGLTYSWSGPGNFSSNQQNPVVAASGNYAVIATNPENGCTSTSSVTVEQDTQVPQNVTATASGTGTITCINTSVTLTGASTTSGVTYSWTGPGTITNTTATAITVTSAGLYTVTVTNPLNNCTVSAGATVAQNTTAPQNVTIATPATITCTTTSASLSASSTTSGVTYNWTGTAAITNPTSATATVSAAGTYHLVVTNPSNGCTTVPADVTVAANTTPPNATISNPDNTTVLTCFISPIRLNGSSNITGAAFHWTSLDGLDVNTQNILVTTPSDYTLIVTNPANGCQRSTTRRITQNLTSPTATANVSGVINCSASSVRLLGSASGTANYSWTGPSGYTSSLQEPLASVAGLYTLTITTPGGCTATASTIVQTDFSAPEEVTASVSGVLNDCGSDIVVLSGTSSTVGVSYNWTGPEGFESTEQDAVTTLAGSYTLVVRHPSSNCTETRQVNVLFENCLAGMGARTASSKSSSTGDAEGAPGENPFAASVYPNPASDRASIEFTPVDDGTAVVEVYSLVNAKVAEPFKGNVRKGKRYTAIFESGSHTNGVYVYRIRYGSGRTSEGRFVVMH